MDAFEYLNKNPVPPPLPRNGNQKLSITLSPGEYELLQLLAHHPVLKLAFSGTLNHVIRYMFYMFASDLEAVVDQKLEPVVQALRDTMRATSWPMTKETINQLLDHKASQLHLLMDSGETTGAYIEFEILLKLLSELEPYWRRIAHRFRTEHRELGRFMDRYAGNDPVNQSALQALLDQYPGG